MDIYKLKWTRLQNEIFRLLTIKVGAQINQREISKTLNVSPTAIAKALVELEKQGIIQIKRQGKINLTFIELNRENRKVFYLKRIENLKLINEVGLSDFLEEKFPGTTIILFGSYSKGEDTIKSDIDIAIIGTTEKNIDLKIFEKSLEREIIINFYKNWKEINKNLRDNILNGITFAGGIDL